ncbi:FAD-dependent oxidoreductase [Soehngenia saccharolytica]|nr:FAD-dependent oxidoreductase [Soehngenia saccharolytica]
MDSLNKEIVLKRIVKETSDIYSFVFEKPNDYVWTAGQHTVFKFKELKIPLAEDEKEHRIFSIASVKEEDEFMFSTRIVDTCTNFKKNLLKLIPGDVMLIDKPMGKFILEDLKKPTVLIAGGIGVTPMRAFLKDIELNKKEVKHIRLLYSDDRNEFAYEKELLQIGENIEGVEVLLISNRDQFNKEIEEFAKQYNNNGNYYISGSPGMNNMFTEKLINMGIDKQNIKTDSFQGY